MSNLYENIEYMCKQNNINVTQLCAIVQVSRSAFSELKAGRSKDISSSNRKKVATFFNVDLEYLDKDFPEIPCPLCGMMYSSSSSNDQISHAIRHKKWENAVKKFGFCWNDSYRDAVRSCMREKICSEPLTPHEKVECYENICKAYFSRALQANDYPLDFISFEDYIAGLLGNNSKLLPAESTEERKMMLRKYGKKEGLLEGTYFSTGNTPVWSEDYLEDNKDFLESLECEDEKQFSPVTVAEKNLISNYRRLTPDGQKKVDGYVEGIAKETANIIQKPIAAFGGAETLTVDSDVLKAAIDAALKEKGLI